MKKFLVFSVCVCMLLSGCIVRLPNNDGSGNIDFGDGTQDTTGTGGTVVTFEEQKILSQLEVTGYKCDGDFWHYGFLIVKNNSDWDIQLSVSVKLYNAADKLIGAKNMHEEVLEKGTECLLYFMPDEAFARMEYELSAAESEYYEGVVSELTYETVSAKNKEVVTVTNTGNKAADFVQGYALFFKGNQVVGFDNTYFTDDDSEIKPKKSITEELTCYDTYDNVKFYFSGRRHLNDY